MSLTVNQIRNIVQKLDFFASENNIYITPFKSFEDDSTYEVWLIECALGKFVLKNAKNFEAEIYTTFFKNKINSVPQFLAEITDGDTIYIIIEYIKGETFCKCDRQSLQKALDALILLQDKYWNDSTHNNIGYTFEKSMQSRINRGKYLCDEELEKVYQEFLSVYSKIPRTLCHDDLLPFNVIVGENSASLIDWEYAGILPYPTSIARLLAHTEENENALFYMTNEDKEFAKKYYYDNLVSKHDIPYDEYKYTVDLFFLYEYCEWIMLANKYPDADKERAAVYTRKAKFALKQIDERNTKDE